MPINKLTIPGLELMGCILGARLGKTINISFASKAPCFFWSHLTKALAWIKRIDE